MAYIRKSRNSYFLVEGVRNKKTGKLKQRLLHTLWSKLEIPKKITDKYLTEENLDKVLIRVQEKFWEELKITE